MNLFHSPQPTANHGSTLTSYRGHSISSSARTRASFSTLHQIHLHLYASQCGFSVGLRFNSRPGYLLGSPVGSVTGSLLHSALTIFCSSHTNNPESLPLTCSHCSLTPVCSPMQSWDSFTLHKNTLTPRGVRGLCCGQRCYTEPHHLSVERPPTDRRSVGGWRKACTSL